MAAVVFQELELTPQRRAWRRLARRGGAMVGLAVVLFFIVTALFAPWLAPYDPVATSWSAVRGAPSASHWFGADELARDRRADRDARRVPRTLGRRPHLAHHRRDARLPLPHPRHRARRLPRAEPHQRQIG